jgi:hypothetical protein
MQDSALKVTQATFRHLSSSCTWRHIITQFAAKSLPNTSTHRTAVDTEWSRLDTKATNSSRSYISTSSYQQTQIDDAMTDRREPPNAPSGSPYTPHQDRTRPWNRPLPIFTSENDGSDAPEYMFTRPNQPTNGTITNDHTTNGHTVNTHTPNGHIAIGHTPNGYDTNGETTNGVTSNDHISNIHTTNGLFTDGHNSSFPTRATRTYATRVIQSSVPIHQGINGTYRARHDYRPATRASAGRHRIATDGFQDLTPMLQEPEQHTTTSQENSTQASTATRANGTQTVGDNETPDLVVSDEEAGSDFEIVEGGRSEPNGQARGWYGRWFGR